MCGISAYLGCDAAFRALYMTLHQLERGRLGSGVGYVKGGRVMVVKEPVDPYTHLSNVLYQLDQRIEVAVAHNRLPSRGGVCYVNTHPFLSCSGEFCLVHNGSNLNHSIEALLVRRSHRVEGSTDSELLMHRLEEIYEGSGDMASALEELMSEGCNGAFLVLTREGEVYGIRDYTHPIVIATKGGEFAVASTERAVRSLFRDEERLITPMPYRPFMIRRGRLRVEAEPQAEARFRYWLHPWFYRRL